MALSGKNELERFTDKIGYNKIWPAIVECFSVAYSLVK